MGYALLANQSAVNGLYISCFPLLVYALLGTSRHLSIGALAIISLMSGNVVQTMTQQRFPDTTNGTSSSSSANDTEITAFKVAIATSLASLVGIIQLLLGASGLGVIATLFSDTFISGFTCGSGVHVLVSQLKSLFGLTKTTRYEGFFKIPKVITHTKLLLQYTLLFFFSHCRLCSMCAR